ncbi:MAG: hypothetical protein WDN28_13190 [Chthoniobacter sp.]
MVTAANNGSGILAINSLYTQAIDLAHIGDGTWFLGSSGNGAGLNGTYVGATPADRRTRLRWHGE